MKIAMEGYITFNAGFYNQTIRIFSKNHPQRWGLLIFLVLINTVGVYGAAITSGTSGNWSASAWPNTTRTGTISSSTGSAIITGSGTSFMTELSVGNIIKTSPGNVAIGTVASIQSNTSLTLTTNGASTNSGIAYNAQGTGSGDDITIANGASLTVDGDYSCTTLTFAATTTSNTITISGTYTLTVSGLITMPRPSGGAECTINVGAGNLSCGSLTMNATTAGRNDVILVSTGTFSVNGTTSVGSGGCQFTLSGAGTMNFGGTTLSSAAITTVAGSVVQYNASGNQTVRNASYSTLILSGSGSKTVSGSVVINDTLCLRGTAVTSGSAVSYNAGAVLKYKGASVQTTTNNEFQSTMDADVIVDNPNGVILNAMKTVTGNVLLLNGELSVSPSNFNISVAGNWTNNGGTFTGGTGTVTFTGSGKTIGGTNSTPFSGLTFGNGSSYTMDNSNSCTGLTLTATSTSTSLTLGVSNPTLTVNGTVVMNQPTSNTINNALNINGGTVTASGLLSTTGTNTGSRICRIVITTGTLNANGGITFASSVASNNIMDMSGGAGTINLSGTITKGTSTLTPGTSSTFNYIDATAQTIAAYTYYNLTNTGNGSRTFVSSGTIDIAGVYTPSTGSRTVTGSTVNFNGSNGQTIPADSYNNLTSSNNSRILDNGTIKIAGTFTPGSSNYTIGTSTVEFNGSTAITIPVLSVASGANYYNLTFSGTANAWTLGGAMTIGGNFTVSASGAGKVVFNNTTSSRSVTITGNYVQSGGVVDLATGGSGGTTSIYLGGNINHSGGTTTQSGTPGTNGAFYFNGSGIQSITLNDLSSYTFLNYTVMSGATLQLGSNINLIQNSSSAYAGVMTVSPGGTIIFPSTYTVSMGGGSAGNNPVFNLNSGATMITANASGVGSSVPSSSMTRNFDVAANYAFNGSPGQNTGLVNTTVNDLRSNLSGVLNLNSNATVNGTLILTSGTLTPGAFTLSIAGSVTRTSGLIDASNSSSIVAFTNSSALTLPSGLWSTAVKNLTMNGAGGVTLGSPTTVTGILNMTNGIIFSSSGTLLTVDSLGIASNASGSSFVNGPIKKTGRFSFIFPVGKTGTGYQAIEISGPSTHTDAFTAEYMRVDATSLGTTYASPLMAVSQCEYWQLDRTAGTSNVEVTLYGNSNSGCGAATGATYFTGSGSPVGSLKVAHWTGTQWEDAASTSTAVSGSSPNLTVKATTVGNFSPFTFGTISNNPIPVKLIDFKGSLRRGYTRLDWSTATERNNDHFDIERSTDGVLFSKVGEVAGKGNSFSTTVYGFNDNTISEIAAPVLYYRLKQVDFSGEFELSKIIVIRVPVSEMSLMDVSPNPFRNEIAVRLSVPEGSNVILSITDVLGRVVERREMIQPKNVSTVLINTSSYPSGIYQVKLCFHGDLGISKRIIKE